jgi:site-specific recombinase XerD
LAIRGKAETTQKSYVSAVARLARHYGRSPELLSYDEVADWLFHLVRERKLAYSSVNIAVNALRFLYGVTLQCDLAELRAKVPRMKRQTKRAHAYAVEEVEAILRAALRPRERAFLMLVYSCGLRLTEACTLRVTDIDRARMQVRVQGKGAKERLCPLSRTLLDALQAYWRSERSGKPRHDDPWLFLGEKPGQPVSVATGRNIYYRAVRRSGVRRKAGGIHVLRHSFATHLIESGVEITLVQRLLGHSSLATTALYLHVTAARLDRVRSAMDLIDSNGLGSSAANR